MTNKEFLEKIDRKQIRQLGELTNERSYARAEAILNAKEICQYEVANSTEEGVFVAKCCATALDIIGAIALSVLPIFLLLVFVSIPVFSFIGPGKLLLLWLVLSIATPFVIKSLLVKMRRQHALEYVYEMQEKEAKINSKIEALSKTISDSTGGVFPKKYCYFNQLYLFMNLKDKGTTVEQYVEHLERKYAGMDSNEIALAGVDGKRENLYQQLETLFTDGNIIVNHVEGSDFINNGSFENKVVEQLEEERLMNKEKNSCENNKYLIMAGFGLSIFSMIAGPLGLFLFAFNIPLIYFSVPAAVAAYLLMGGVPALTGALKWAFKIMLSNIWTGGFSLFAWVIAGFLMFAGFVIGVMRFVILPIRYAFIYRDEREARAECVEEYFRNNPKTVKQKVCVKVN